MASFPLAQRSVCGGIRHKCKGTPHTYLMSRCQCLMPNMSSTAQFKGVIPGGESFAIPQGTITNVTNEGTGFNWTPNVRSGTMLVLVAGDDRGPGTGGSNAYTVQTGSSSSCLNGTSPSSTPGSPAGGSYPTSTDGSGTGSNTSGGCARYPCSLMTVF